MTTYTARSAEDVLALVPVVLGFQPHDSLVMLTFGGRRPFHARVDLPPPDEVEACVSALLEPARRHGVAQVVFVALGSDHRGVRTLARALERRFTGAGLRVIDVIRADGGRWFSPLGRGDVPAEGVPYDVSDHPFRIQAVVDGQVMAGSRDDLVERVRTDARAAATVADVLAGQVPPDGPRLRAMLERHLAAGTVPAEEEAARILLAVCLGETRDHAWVGMRRDEAVHHVRLWTDLVRRAPDGLVAGAAGVLAFAAWMHGDGALAWCAVDRCLDEDPEHGLGRLVADLLEGAVAPLEEWPAELGLPRFPQGLAG